MKYPKSTGKLKWCRMGEDGSYSTAFCATGRRDIKDYLVAKCRWVSAHWRFRSWHQFHGSAHRTDGKNPVDTDKPYSLNCSRRPAVTASGI